MYTYITPYKCVHLINLKKRKEGNTPQELNSEIVLILILNPSTNMILHPFPGNDDQNVFFFSFALTSRGQVGMIIVKEQTDSWEMKRHPI